MSTNQTCALCRQQGHNRKSCPHREQCKCPFYPRSPVPHEPGCPLAAKPTLTSPQLDMLREAACTRSARIPVRPPQIVTARRLQDKGFGIFWEKGVSGTPLFEINAAGRDRVAWEEEKA